MDERRAEEAIKALNKAGAIKVGTAEGTPVSREHAKEIVQAIRKQKRDELAVDDIVTRLLNIASLKGDIGGTVIPVACKEAADEIERLRRENDWYKAVNTQLQADPQNQQEDKFITYLKLALEGENNELR